MAILKYLFIGILLLQIYVNAAPSDVGKLEDIAKVEKADESSDPAPKDVQDNEDSTETTRQKRFYNPIGYGFPPINPVIYPNFNRRDDLPNFGNFGEEDPITQIHRRVQEIANIVRQPPLQGIPHIPVFYPVLFVPSFDCQCYPTNTQPTGEPTTDETPPEEVTLQNRFPDIEDGQNWGMFINNTNAIDNKNENKGIQDFRRPISFDPVRVNRPGSRPTPPVEHGTLEGSAAANQKPQSSGNNPSPPAPPSTRPPLPPPVSSPGPQNSLFNTNQLDNRPPQKTTPIGPPSACDGAILTCCHRPHVVYDCFAIQGCPNLTTYGNPCQPNSILRILSNFQRYYGSRNRGF